MAFDRASGWENLPNGRFSPTVYSQQIQKAFRNTSVVDEVTNNDYYGEIANFGDSVEIIMEPDVAITNYARGETPTSTPLTDTVMSLTVDKANMFQFEVEDIEHKHSHVNWQSMATNRAAYNLKNEYDREVLEYMTTVAGVTDTLGTNDAAANLLTIALSGSPDFTPLGLMNRVKRLFDEANVPDDQRWFVASPKFWELMEDENNKLIEADTMGEPNTQSIVRNGRVTRGQIRGFDCFKSNNLKTGTVGGTDYVAILAGHKSAVATAQQIAQTESFRSPFRFADVVRGLHLYGRGVIRSEALAVSWMAV